MYAPHRPAARAAPAPFGREPVGFTRRRSTSRRRPRSIDPVEMPADAHDATAAVDARLRQCGVHLDDPIVVVHVSAGNPFRRWPIEHFVDADREARPATSRRAASSSRQDPRKGMPRQRVIAGARSALGGDAASARRFVRRVFVGRAPRALRSCRALHRRRQRSPAHRRHDRRAHRRPYAGRRCRCVRRPGEATATPTESVDVGKLPCRPCDQRVCAPGDFRCLTRIQPGTGLRGPAVRVLR